MNALEVYKKKIEPFIAIAILIMLISLVIGIKNNNELKEQIRDNCGYTTDDYYCKCYDASEYMDIEFNYNDLNLSFGG